VDHLLAMNTLCEYVYEQGMNENLVVVSPDAGFAKQARKYAFHLKAPVAIGDKTRLGHDENAQVLELIGDVCGKNCLIVDDFTISGGTLINIAEALKEHGARKIYACVSHIVMKQKSIKAIQDSPIDLLISTDTVENEWLQTSNKIKIVSVAPIFAETVRRIHFRESVSPLFDSFLPKRS
jgi:ribose-phosphate pyrophosphokinase